MSDLGSVTFKLNAARWNSLIFIESPSLWVVPISNLWQPSMRPRPFDFPSPIVSDRVPELPVHFSALLRIEGTNVCETDAESGSTDGIQLLLSSHKVNRALHVLDAFMGFECHGRR